MLVRNLFTLLPIYLKLINTICTVLIVVNVNVRICSLCTSLFIYPRNLTLVFFPPMMIRASIAVEAGPFFSVKCKLFEMFASIPWPLSPAPFLHFSVFNIVLLYKSILIAV